jgi:hypothetical protein
MAVGKDGDLAPVGRKRRSWKRDEKRQIVEESLQDGASIAEVARRHDLNAKSPIHVAPAARLGVD